MSTRAWYRYNDIPGGQLNPVNYIYRTAIPICSITDPAVCAILGVYQFASSHPATFSPRMNSYISDALSYATAQPATSGRLFVYMKP